jgi:hypothetical protein
MDIKRFITKEDFLSIKSLEECGTILDGRRYATLPWLSSEEQLSELGEPDATGEGIKDKVFFFEVFKDPFGEGFPGEEVNTTFQIVSAEVVDRYKYVSNQEARKEVALVKAKIALKERKKGE